MILRNNVHARGISLKIMYKKYYLNIYAYKNDFLILNTQGMDNSYVLFKRISYNN